MRILRQELYFPLIVAIHFVFWGIDLALYQGAFHDAEADTCFFAYSRTPGDLHPMRIAGEVFSSWVVTVFAFNFLMATRARWVERIFGGLDKMYLIHRRSGVIAVVLLLAHFITVPRDLTAFTVGKPLGFWALVLILIGVVISAAPPIKKRLPYPKWLPIHKLMGVFYTMGVAHAFLVHSLIWELPLTRMYVFGMSAVGVFSWLYRAVFSRWLAPRTAHNVTHVERLPGDVLDLRLSQDGAASFEPGQFAFLTLPGVSKESHPFTLASAPGEPPRFLIKNLGDYTGALPTQIQVGDAALLEAPYGHFTLRHTRHTRQVWIAGGIGITPFISLLSGVGARHVQLFWSVNEASEAFCLEELEEGAERSGVQLIPWFSTERGYLNVDDLLPEGEASEGFWQNTSFLLCGPAGLKDALTDALRKKGVSTRDIHEEAFSFR